jgi:tRNA-dependent cyclodipeptide synthase
MIEYRVKAKKSPDWKKYKTACLAVSVGREYHEGDKLKAAIEWINTRFQFVIVDVADTLQRHNLMLEQGLSETLAYEKARRMGDEWLERNKEPLNAFRIPVRIDCWDDRLKHPQYRNTRVQFEQLYWNNNVFQQAVNTDAARFVRRQMDKNPEVSVQHAFENSVKYLLEETAALTLFYRENPCATIYPSSSTLCFETIKQGMIKNAPKGMENDYHTRITFIPRSSQTIGIASSTRSQETIFPYTRSLNLHVR